MIGFDNLHEALDFILRKGFSQHNSSTQQHSIWIHINTDIGLADHAKWDKQLLGSTCWIEITNERLMKIQLWLINNCFIKLGITIWQQKNGIPMGFSYSPMWYNLYFMAYEIQFISRLIMLRHFDLLSTFEQAYRYIDDICILNAPSISMFLDPS